MGYDAMSDGHFAEALAHYTAAEQAGIGGSARQQSRRQALWALARADTLFAELATARQAEPMSLTLADEEIRATLAFRHDRAAAEKLKAGYLAAYKASGTSGEYLEEIDSFLQGSIAYQLKDWELYARTAAKLGSPGWKFTAACSQGDVPQTTAALQALEHPDSEKLLLLYLLTQRAGDAAAAEAHFKKAVETMKTESGKHRKIAELLTAGTPDPKAICAVRLGVDDKRVLLTALGVHDPAGQAVYFDAARKLNFSPEFPYHFLRPILGQSI